jgi:hypothetical protein
MKYAKLKELKGDYEYLDTLCYDATHTTDDLAADLHVKIPGTLPQQ